jgi:hypothetical protein
MEISHDCYTVAMADPTSSTIIGSLVKALLDIAAKRLPKFKRRSRLQPQGYDFKSSFMTFTFRLKGLVGKSAS